MKKSEQHEHEIQSSFIQIEILKQTMDPWSSRNSFCYKKEQEFIGSSSETLINNKEACSAEMAY